MAIFSAENGDFAAFFTEKDTSLGIRGIPCDFFGTTSGRAL